MKGSHIRVTRRNVCKRDQNGIKANQCGSTFELLDGPTAQRHGRGMREPIRRRLVMWAWSGLGHIIYGQVVKDNFH